MYEFKTHEFTSSGALHSDSEQVYYHTIMLTCHYNSIPSYHQTVIPVLIDTRQKNKCRIIAAGNVVSFKPEEL
jgi:hypothetical protein